MHWSQTSLWAGISLTPRVKLWISMRLDHERRACIKISSEIGRTTKHRPTQMYACYEGHLYCGLTHTSLSVNLSPRPLLTLFSTSCWFLHSHFPLHSFNSISPSPLLPLAVPFCLAITPCHSAAHYDCLFQKWDCPLSYCVRSTRCVFLFLPSPHAGG